MEKPDKIKIDSATKVLETLMENYECDTHKETIFNCRVTDGYGIYYETCCLKFKNFISQKVNTEFPDWNNS